MELLGASGRPTDLGIQPDDVALQHASSLTRWPLEAIRRQTFLGLRPTWPRHWATWTAPLETAYFGCLSFEHLPRLQVCRSCLREDLSLGTQFLRIRWLSAATTFCVRHMAPLQAPCSACRGVNSVHCERVPHRFILVCPECKRTLDSGHNDVPLDPQASRLLIEFERNLEKALDGIAPGPAWVGACTAKQFVSCIEDLVWALTCPMSDWVGSPAPIKWFQVKAFPLIWRFEPYRGLRHRLAHSSVWLRRALLAATLGILCGDEIRSILNLRPLPFRFRHDLPELLDILNPAVKDKLAGRSRRWPRQLRPELSGELARIASVYSIKKKSTNYG